MGAITLVAIIGAGVALGTGRFEIVAGIGAAWLVLSWILRPTREPYKVPAAPIPQRDLNTVISDPKERAIYGLPPRPATPTQPGAEPPSLNDILGKRGE